MNSQDCSFGWVGYCGKLSPPTNAFLHEISQISCYKDLSITAIDLISMIIFWSNLLVKWRHDAGYLTALKQERPFYRVLSLLMASFGAFHMGLGLVEVAKLWQHHHSLMPLHEWVMFLFHGVAWLTVGYTLTLSTKSRVESVFIRLWWSILFVLGTVQAILSISSLRADGEISLAIVLPLASWPLCCLLIFSAWKKDTKNVENILREPLLTESVIAEKKSFRSTSNLNNFARAGLLSKLTFWWLNPLLSRGRKKLLEEEDLPNVSVEDQAGSAYSDFAEELIRIKRENPSSSPSVMWTLFHNQKKKLVFSGACAFTKICALSCGPLFLNAFIKFAQADESSRNQGFILVGLLFASKILESLAERQWLFTTRRVGMQVRSAVIAAIYKKQLKLSHAARQTHTAGEINNYVSVDAFRIGEFLFWIHQTWTTILQLFLTLLVLFYTIGWATLTLLAIVILTALLNTPVAKLQHKFQTQLMGTQDERLRAMSETLCHIKVLKLHAWEGHFKKNIEKLRENEFKWLSAIQFRKAYSSMLFWTCAMFASPLAFATCYLLGVPLTASNVFTFIATMRIVQDPVSLIPDVLAITIQAKVSLNRVEKFLDVPELQTEAVEHYNFQNDERCISIKSATLSWDNNASKPTLRDINIEVKATQKVAICGEVGSGKSTLLASILGEVPKLKGHLQVWGSIAYVSQSAWIQTGTVRENILFGQPFEEEKYHNVIANCLLVKDLESFAFGDQTQIGERGVNLSGGQKQRIQLARALYQDADIYLLDDPLSAVDADTASSLFKKYMTEALSGKTIVLATHQVDFLDAFDSILVLVDGQISRAGKYADLLVSCKEFKELLTAQTDESSMTSSETTTHPSPSYARGNSMEDMEIENIFSYEKLSNDNQLIKQEEKETGDTGYKPYVDYLKQNKGFIYFSLLGAFQLIFVATTVSQNSWMASNVGNPHLSTLKLIAVYSALGFVGTIFIYLRSATTAIMGLRASESFFAELTNCLIRSPMSFFDSTPLGRILSRVSSDLNILDLDIPFTMVFALIGTLNVYTSVGVIAVVSWQVMIVVLPMIYLVMLLQRYYLSTAKELMRINGITKSPISNHLGESIAGGMTIRAFKAENRFFEKSLRLTDRNASPFFHTFSANEWLIQRLEFLSATVLCSSALSMVLQSSNSLNPGFIGMALSYGLSLSNNLVLKVQSECTVANDIVSVERIRQYMNIPSEAPEVIEDHRPPSDWPSSGRVELHNLKIRYRADSPMVLKGITCVFESGHKIGVVGRTGSGKSTLISALFRLVEFAGGKIIIDGIDIATIGLHDLRSCIGIIPQEPTLFNGTIRFNLDPLSQFTDMAIWEALDKCQLGDIVREKLNGIDSLVGDDGNNWSLGQRQLFCLGRALLRRSKVLVMDEATASIDNATDATIQTIIKREFGECTIIIVAHRISTVIDSDMVLAISDGKMVEYDKPLRLVRREGSLFRMLVSEYWSHSSNSHAHPTI